MINGTQTLPGGLKAEEIKILEYAAQKSLALGLEIIRAWQDHLLGWKSHQISLNLYFISTSVKTKIIILSPTIPRNYMRFK